MPDLVVEPEEKQELEERRLGSMSLLQHLEELRKRIIYSVAAVALCFGVGWSSSDRIFAKMSVPISKALINHHYETDRDRGNRIDDALPQLFQVLQQAHRA